MYSIEEVRKIDPEIAAAIEQEVQRQNDHIELIASENWTSKAVMAAMGSPLTNKYAEGYSGKRYYGGCQVVDIIETIAIERAKKLFGCTYANVQPHSGASANLAVEFAILQPGDTLMGMNLNMGGHLTHGSPANISGTYYNVVPYGVDENGFIDYDELKRLAIETKPKMIIAGASAYCRTIDFKKFREAADACGAVLMAHKTLRGPRGGLILAMEETAKKYNFNKAVFPGTQGGPLEHVIAAKAVCFQEALQPSFKTYMQQVAKNAQALSDGLQKRGVDIVSGGTDNHLMLVDLTKEDLTGKEVEKWLDEAHITANKNTIPTEKRSPFVTSGIRLGSPAATTRGLVEEDMDQVAEAIALVIKNKEAGIEPAREIIAKITAKYPLD